jgi:hypothetical protein
MDYMQKPVYRSQFPEARSQEKTERIRTAFHRRHEERKEILEESPQVVTCVIFAP